MRNPGLEEAQAGIKIAGIKPTTIINTPFLELSNDPARPAGLVAMGRGTVCAWKWQVELRGVSWRFCGAGAEVQLTSRWAPA